MTARKALTSLVATVGSCLSGAVAHGSTEPLLVPLEAQSDAAVGCGHPWAPSLQSDQDSSGNLIGAAGASATISRRYPTYSPAIPPTLTAQAQASVQAGGSVARTAGTWLGSHDPAGVGLWARTSAATSAKFQVSRGAVVELVNVANGSWPPWEVQSNSNVYQSSFGVVPSTGGQIRQLNLGVPLGLGYAVDNMGTPLSVTERFVVTPGAYQISASVAGRNLPSPVPVTPDPGSSASGGWTQTATFTPCVVKHPPQARVLCSGDTELILPIDVVSDAIRSPSGVSQPIADTVTYRWQFRRRCDERGDAGWSDVPGLLEVDDLCLEELMDAPVGPPTPPGTPPGPENTLLFIAFGQDSRRLIISQMLLSNGMQFRCLVSSYCGSADEQVIPTVRVGRASRCAACNPADVTGVGGPPTAPDGVLTGDDFTAFVNALVAGDPLADIVGIGGAPSPPDGLLTGDDFNEFINNFAAGCP